MALVLAAQADVVLPVLTVAFGAAAFFVYTGHRTTYMSALEQALSRAAVAGRRENQRHQQHATQHTDPQPQGAARGKPSGWPR